jgi:hypothetical protein
MADGCYAECHLSRVSLMPPAANRALYAECLYAECLYAECRYAECHYAECLYAECRYAECRYAECRGAAADKTIKKELSRCPIKLDKLANFKPTVLNN